jgi:CubicO group peptidase (beta-lactamase class C family)
LDETDIELPDLLTELQDRTQLTRRTICRILVESLRLDDFIFGAKGILGFDYGKSCPERVDQITLHHLLTHTCGGWQNDGADPMFQKPHMNQRELITWTLRERPLQHSPGKHHAYSNFGYCILGRVLEKLTGQPYEEYVRKSILAQCGVLSLRVAANTLKERFPHEAVYYGQNGENPYGMNVARMDAHGGWIGSPTDLVRFAMHVDGSTPQILRSESVKKMTAPTEASPNYACGWAVNGAPNWWHSGSLPGTTTLLVRTATGLCWAAFMNTRTREAGAALDRFMWNMARAVPAWEA